MNPPLRRIFYWSARVLGIFLVTLVARMHLSGIDLNLPFGQALLELLSRLWLTLILIVVLVTAWRWEIPGGILYLALAGLAYLDAGNANWMEYLILAAPVVITGLLFIFSGLMDETRRKKR
jgi:hypothetical protein